MAENTGPGQRVPLTQEKKSEIIGLREIELLTYPEISESMNLPVSTVCGFYREYEKQSKNRPNRQSKNRTNQQSAQQPNQPSPTSGDYLEDLNKQLKELQEKIKKQHEEEEKNQQPSSLQHLLQICQQQIQQQFQHSFGEQKQEIQVLQQNIEQIQQQQKQNEKNVAIDASEVTGVKNSYYMCTIAENSSSYKLFGNPLYYENGIFTIAKGAERKRKL